MAHFLSGANLGGGVAWLGVLCNTTYGFAVSGNINGGTSFPVTQGSNTWDFFVMAHETGHNFGTLHTHDGYCPPLDECATNCNGNIQCTNQGTNMSYCHGCNGGMNNITTYFHPTVVGVMRAFADSSCIPDLGSGTPIVLFADDFESGHLGAGGWKTSNKKAQVVTGAKHEGQYGVRIRSRRWIEKTLDTTGYKNINVSLWRKTKNYDPGEHLRLRWHNGHNWHTLEDATNPGWGSLSFALDHSANNNPHLRLRFRSVASQGNERGHLDEIVVTGEFYHGARTRVPRLPMVAHLKEAGRASLPVRLLRVCASGLRRPGPVGHGPDRVQRRVRGPGDAAEDQARATDAGTYHGGMKSGCLWIACLTGTSACAQLPTHSLLPVAREQAQGQAQEERVAGIPKRPPSWRWYAGGSLLVTAYGLAFWNWGSSGFHLRSEGWLSSDTRSGGADKFGHAWFAGVVTAIRADPFPAQGHPDPDAARPGARPWERPRHRC
mgnify:CR=1 FL=1